MTAAALAASLVLLAPQTAQPTAPASGAAALDHDELVRWIDATRAAFRTPGVALALVDASGATFLHGSGIRDAEHRPVTPDSLFAIGSQTKSFTTAVVATLVDEGRLDWDTPVQEVLEWYRLADDGATAFCALRDLACHRTGIPRTTSLWLSGTRSRRELVEALAGVPLTAEFASKWQYNNVQYAALGLVVESVTGEAWEDVVRARIFEPLGMTRARFEVRDAALDDVARGFAVQGADVAEIERRNIDAIGPAGSIEASARDMARWIAMHLSHGKAGERVIVPRARLEETYEPLIELDLTGADTTYALAFPGASKVEYGLGWFVATQGDLTVIEHGGGIDGFSSLVGFVPELGAGYVILQNMEMGDSMLAVALREGLIERLAGREARAWGPDMLTAPGIARGLDRDPAAPADGR